MVCTECIHAHCICEKQEHPPTPHAFETPQPRTEAFSAVPVGAQAYFNSQAGVGTLAIIPGGIATASSISAAGVGLRSNNGSGGGSNNSKKRVVMKRGWHARNKFTRVAKEDRLMEEQARKKNLKKRARSWRAEEERGSSEDDDNDDDDGDNDGQGGVDGCGGYAGGGGYKLEELLRATQVRRGCSCCVCVFYISVVLK